MSQPLLILYATTTGNAQICADRIADAAKKHGYEPRVWDVEGFDIRLLETEPVVLFSVSTYGDGDPSDSALFFWSDVELLAPGSLASLRYSVYALGDSSYADFCGFGRKLDEELAAKGATRVAPRRDVDVDYEAGLDSWSSAVFGALTKADEPASV